MARLDIGERQRDQPVAIGQRFALAPGLGPIDDLLEGRQIARRHEGEALVERVAGLHAREDFQHHLGEPQADGRQFRRQAVTLDDLPDIAVRGEALLRERLVDGHAEQEVFADGGVRVEARRVERLDEARHAALRELVLDGAAHLDEALGHGVVGAGVNLAEKPESVDVLVEAQKREQFEAAPVEFGRLLDAGRRQVEPAVAGQFERVAAHPRLVEPLRLLLR